MRFGINHTVLEAELGLIGGAQNENSGEEDAHLK